MHLITQAKADSTDVSFNGNHLDHHGAKPGILNAIEAQMVILAEKMKTCMICRFRDMEVNDKISCLKLLEWTLWPRQEDDLAEFGVTVLDTFIEQFKQLLEAKNVQITELHEETEWSRFKVFWLHNLTHLSRSSLWESVIRRYEENFPFFSCGKHYDGFSGV